MGTNSMNRGFGPVFGAAHQRVWSARWLRFDLTKTEKPQAAHHRTSRGKAGPDEQGQGGAVADTTQTRTGQREDQADQGRPQGLPDEPPGGENAAGAAGAFARGAGKDGAVVGGLEEAKPDAADRHTPGDSRHRRVRFLSGHQNESQPQYGQANPPQ